MNFREFEMSLKLFEGKGDIRKVRRKKDKQDFELAMKKFGFKTEVDLVSFCVAIALYEKFKKGIEIKENPSLMQMAKMYSFKKAELYDLIIFNYLNTKENRLEKFEEFFYYGFKKLRDWLNDYGVDYMTEIETVCGFVNDFYQEKT